MVLRPVAHDLWTLKRSQRFLGIDTGTRMTVVRLADGTLLVHSPVCLDPPLQRQLDQLGQVRHVVAPNKWHHLYVGDYQSTYPAASVYAAPGLPEKRPELTFDEVLATGTTYSWSAEIDHVVCEGRPAINEVAFLHKPSRTLILTDLVHCFGPEHPWPVRLQARIGGVYGRPGRGRFDRLLWLRDKSAASASLHYILSWDFDRVIIAHGEILDRDVKNALRRAFAM